MIYFQFNVENPFSDRWKTLFFKNGLLPRHKAWEFNGYLTHNIIDIDFRYTRNCDHAGLQLMFGLLGVAIEFSIYDTRHWDWDKNEYS
jgi:hypothetical protein